MMMNKMVFAVLLTALVSVPLVRAWDCDVAEFNYCACLIPKSAPPIVIAPRSCYIEDGGAYISCMNLYVTVQNLINFTGSGAYVGLSIWNSLLQGTYPTIPSDSVVNNMSNNYQSYVFSMFGQVGKVIPTSGIAGTASSLGHSLLNIASPSTAQMAYTPGCNYGDVPYVHLSNLHMAVIQVSGYPKTDATALALVKAIVSQTSAQDLQNFFVNNDSHLTLGVISLAGLLLGPDGTTGGQTAAFLQTVHDAVTDPSCIIPSSCSIYDVPAPPSCTSSCPKLDAIKNAIKAETNLIKYGIKASSVPAVQGFLRADNYLNAQAQDLDPSSATYGQSAFQIALANCNPADSTQPCYQIALALSCAPQSANLNCPYVTSSGGLSIPTCSDACTQLTKGTIAAAQATTSAQNLVSKVSTVIYNPNNDSLSLLQALLGSTPLSSIMLPDILPNGQILSDRKNPKDAAWSVYLNLKSQLTNDLNNTQNPVAQQTLANEANALVAAANVYHWLCIQYAAQNGLQACDISAADAEITTMNNLVNTVNNATNQVSTAPVVAPVTSQVSAAPEVATPTTCPKGKGITKNGTCGKCLARQGVMKNGKCGKCPTGQGIGKNGICGTCKKINAKTKKCE